MGNKERLIQIFEHAVNKAWGEGFDYIGLSPRDGKKILKLLKEQEAQGWVSVKDRLPEKSGEYLVIKRGGPQVLSYSERHKAFNAYDILDEPKHEIKVTHWMPLPEPPKEEES